MLSSRIILYRIILSQAVYFDVSQDARSEREIWRSYPSWGQFSWLYFFTFLTGLRGLLILRVGLEGWAIWMAGAMVLLIVTALLRHWVCYVLTPTQIFLQNGYTQNILSSMKLEKISNIELIQGPIARYWGIGTLVIQASHGEHEIRLRGVKAPDVVEAKLRALLPVMNADSD